MYQNISQNTQTYHIQKHNKLIHLFIYLLQRRVEELLITHVNICVKRLPSCL